MKIKSVLPEMLVRFGLVQKKSSWSHSGPFQENVPCARNIQHYNIIYFLFSLVCQIGNEPYSQASRKLNALTLCLLQLSDGCTSRLQMQTRERQMIMGIHNGITSSLGAMKRQSATWSD